MNNKEKVKVEVLVDAPIWKAWQYFTEPEHVMQWNHASDDWHCPSGDSDVRTGGNFNFRMEARDGSSGFDFTGMYDEVVPNEKIAYHLGDRKVETIFTDEEGKTRVATVFEAEDENPIEMQRTGWQAILDNYKKHTETN